MVNVLIDDIFKSKAQTLVNTVNCVGVMGKGIALEFKKRFPEMYEDYVRRCKAKEVKLGQPYLYRSLLPPWILNFPTKDHWRSVSRLEDILDGLDYLKRHLQEWGITSLAVPPLGCGHGRLEWRVVGPALYQHLKRLHIPVELYAPCETPHEELQATFLEQRLIEKMAAASSDRASLMKPAWIALVKILQAIEAERYHYPVGRTSFQKIAYFATESGIPTGLSYQRGSYGPYAPELKTLVTRLVNNGLIREERLGRMFAVKTGPTFADACRACEGEWLEWKDTIEALADLFLRMDTRQAELAATVHFAAKDVAAKNPEGPSELDVLHEVMRWKQKRRPALEATEIAAAIRGLGMLGWLKVRSSSELPVSEEMVLGL
ncbi:macro domain-containing protein [Methylacidimicrobium sp. B4]|uniref:type II toxin-antitoxin system antitoxin DNA ADP-ribosyl glycohydrolase DarG n=1 Tax=Methylacidimicrobium sp. B4 TaxID=2796139 RepID=UPI001A8D07DE|nr:macro domain-containing protein [Methylacidimicrobium sp. B4]QSR84366.1 macro domain-containing protein [Methylacidimicrobium sp. B4]